MFFTNTNGTGRTGDNARLDKLNEWKSEVERVFYTYVDVLESEDCVPRTMCELGLYARSYNFAGKDMLLSLAEHYLPEMMQNNARVLKKAATGGYDKNQCRKMFKCEPPTSAS
ncbi:uncharacterized protein LOC119092046 [Pollicipes pollicipes]|nr:uncharacterized protein LOC119092046 [Pollicipes pollicipes]